MDNLVLSSEERAHFDKWGYVRVTQALSEAFAERVRTVIWRKLAAQYGILETDVSTWKPEWCGINKDKIDGSARTEVTPRLAGAIDQLLGGRPWRPIRTFGGLLMTMPEQNPQAWEVVSKGWHFDNDPCAYIGSPNELMLFTFYSAVRAQGGGTLVLAGSHRLTDAFLKSEAAQGRLANDSVRASEHWQPFDGDFMRAFGRWHPYLAQLQGLQPREIGIEQWMDTAANVHGIEVRVAELTGEPGDAILCHPALFHAASRNASAVPRIMRRTNVRRQKAERRE